MKASELRIGNLLIDNNGNEFQVYGIYRSELVPRDIVLTDLFNGYNELYAEECIPIILNEKWLLKLGFHVEYYDGLPWYEKGCLTLDFMFSFERHDASTFELHFVHSLQNLYFSLTGEELTIKES